MRRAFVPCPVGAAGEILVRGILIIIRAPLIGIARRLVAIRGGLIGIARRLIPIGRRLITVGRLLIIDEMLIRRQVAHAAGRSLGTSSSVSAIARVLESGVAASPVVPITTIEPAPAPVTSTRGSIEGGKNVQK